jgi:uncharacterized RDD family membrane protein YckC
MWEKYLNQKLPKKKYMVKDAGLLRRLFAFIIDLLILNFVVLLPLSDIFKTYLGGTIQKNLATLSNSIPMTISFALIIITLLALAYFTLFQYYYRQTLGMMITKIKVDGSVNLLTSFVRYIFLIPLLPFQLLWIIEPIFLILNKRAILEIITKTRTIHVVQI